MNWFRIAQIKSSRFLELLGENPEDYVFWFDSPHTELELPEGFKFVQETDERWSVEAPGAWKIVVAEPTIQAAWKLTLVRIAYFIQQYVATS